MPRKPLFLSGRATTPPASLAHYLNDDAFRTLAVEFRVINLLPGPEIELSGGYRDDHLMVDQQAFEVGIAIGFSGAVMAVVFAIRRQLFEPFVDVGQQAILGVVHL